MSRCQTQIRLFLKINVMLHLNDVKRPKYKLRVCLRKDTVVVVFDFAEEARCETAQSFLPQLPVRNRLRVLLHQSFLPDRVRACWSERTCNTKATTINIHVNNTTAFNFLAFSTFRQGALVFATSTQLDCSFLLDSFQLFCNRSFYHDLTSSQLFGKP